MANILSTNQIVQKILEDIKSTIPDLDIKPGEIARDLFVDLPAVRLAELYNELQKASSANSISKSVGQDLINYASNFEIVKLSASKATGTAILTFDNVISDFPIPTGSLVYSRNGLSFRIVSGLTIIASNLSQYRATAINYQNDLDYLGNTDRYAVEVVVECTSTGTQGNIAKYSLTGTSIPNITGVLNASSFSQGAATENEAAYKSRILSVFSGASTGTNLGIQNTITTNPFVVDAIVVGPGDPLMTRDGTILEKDANGDYVLDADGEPNIISEGAGNKVDVFVYGRRVVENIDSYIYNDLSGTGDATSSINDFSLGQIKGDENKTITKRRLQNVKNRTLPAQPVIAVAEVIGSRSGVLTPQSIDEFGVSSGNYVLQKDTGVYAESCFGFDKLHWVSNSSNKTEDITKNLYNGQDVLNYSDVLKINSIKRTINVQNENSTVNPLDRTELYLYHKPIRSINRVLNATTGERYVVSNRNPDGNINDLNTTGKIKISGKNLPSVSDTLQVDYEWEYEHDKYNDYYSFILNDTVRSATDVVDWGFSNTIRREQKTLTTNSNTDLIITGLVHNVSSVISVNKFSYNTSYVKIASNGRFIIDELPELISNVISVKDGYTNIELYNTSSGDQTFDTSKIILPSDTSAILNEYVEVYYNAVDLFTINGVSGTFSGSNVYLNAAAKDLASSGDSVEVNYIADTSTVLPAVNLFALPINKNVNNFSLTGSSTLVGIQPITNIYSSSLPIQNLKRSPSKLALTVSGITSPGVINVKGKTIKYLEVVNKVVNSGLKQDLSLFIKLGLGKSSSETLSSNISVCRVAFFEKVSVNQNVVVSVDQEYDIIGYSLLDNSFVLDYAKEDTSLSRTQFELPSTTTNLNNQPVVGEYFRVGFYIATNNDSEDVIFSTNGTIYTEKSFGYINSISVSSGFKTNNNIVGTLTVTSLNQPSIGNKYRVNYDFKSPKAGERITVRYVSNALIGDLTLLLEDNNARAANQDVLVKSTSSILVDATFTISVLKDYNNSKRLVGQNVVDKISNYINTLPLGTALNPSDLINIAYQIAGLDSITVDKFNKSNRAGSVSVIKAMKNEYLLANIITVKVK